MLNDSLAPIKRAFIFFGFMGVAVASLTFGAGLQGSDDQSSSSVAQTKIERNIPTDSQYAAVDPRQKVADRTKRAIPSSQEARLSASVPAVLR